VKKYIKQFADKNFIFLVFVHTALGISSILSLRRIVTWYQFIIACLYLFLIATLLAILLSKTRIHGFFAIIISAVVGIFLIYYLIYSPIHHRFINSYGFWFNLLQKIGRDLDYAFKFFSGHRAPIRYIPGVGLFFLPIIWIVSFSASWSTFRWKKPLLTILILLPFFLIMSILGTNWMKYQISLLFILSSILLLELEGIGILRRSVENVSLNLSALKSHHQIGLMFSVGIVILAILVTTLLSGHVKRPEFQWWKYDIFKRYVISRRKVSYFYPNMDFPSEITLSEPEIVFMVRSPEPGYWRATLLNTTDGSFWYKSDYHASMGVGREIFMGPHFDLSFINKTYAGEKGGMQILFGLEPEEALTLYESFLNEVTVDDDILKEKIETFLKSSQLYEKAINTLLEDGDISDLEELNIPNIKFIKQSYVVKKLISPYVFSINMPVKLNSKYPKNFSVSETGNIMTQDLLKKGDEYDIISVVSTATPEMLRDAGNIYLYNFDLKKYTKIFQFENRPLDPRIEELAKEITSGIDNNYDKVVAIRDYLKQNYYYSLDIEDVPAGYDISNFLFDLKRGYCQHYAASMALMCRLLDIPSRVAVGYTTGTFDPKTSFYYVNRNNIHMWVEVYFPNYGWINFEPTSPFKAPEYAEKIKKEPVGGEAAERRLKSLKELLMEDVELGEGEGIGTIKKPIKPSKIIFGILTIIGAIFLGFCSIIFSKDIRYYMNIYKNYNNPNIYIQASYRRIIHKLSDFGIQKKSWEDSCEYAMRVKDKVELNIDEITELYLLSAYSGKKPDKYYMEQAKILIKDFSESIKKKFVPIEKFKALISLNSLPTLKKMFSSFYKFIKSFWSFHK